MMKPMPWSLRAVLPKKVQAITLPPFGMYANRDQLDDQLLLAHEHVHWAQYERLGLVRFYVTYLWYSWRHGYHENPMEVEARAQSSHDV